MKQTKELDFRQSLWELIYSTESHYSMDKSKSASLVKLSNHMIAKGFVESDTNKVNSALEELILLNKIQRKWDGTYYITTALIPVVMNKETNAFFVDESPIECPPSGYKVYDYFVENKIVGKRNGQHMESVANRLDMTERTLRGIIERINFRGYNLKDGSTFTRKIVGHLVYGYFLAENAEEEDYLIGTYDKKLYKASRKSRILREDFGRDQQMVAKLSKFGRDMIKSRSNDLEAK